MRANELPPSAAKLVSPRALRAYAEALGWKAVEGVNGHISAYTSPTDPKRQVIIPLDERLDDYAERAADAVARLAQFEGRPAREVLDHILLPPADILAFREVSPESEAGDISLEHGARMIEGARKGLLAIAHSIESPRAYHPRLGRDEAKKFLSRCRMTTGRGSFVLNVACLLDQPAALPGLEPVPFGRRVTTLFLDTLAAIDRATRSTQQHLLDPTKTPGISANFCEALAQFRPSGERSYLTVSASWSRAFLPEGGRSTAEVRLDQEVFELAENLAPRLRSVPEPKTDVFFGFVEELRGTSMSGDDRPAGEVRLALILQEEELRARAELNAEDYAKAGQAHLTNRPVALKGVLYRLPRLNRIENLEYFHLLELNDPSTR